MLALLLVLGSLSVPVLAADAPVWRVDDPHGEVRDVAIDVREGTWLSVDVHHGVALFDLLGDL